MGLHGMQRFFLVKSGQYLVLHPSPPLHLVVANQLIGQKWPITPFLPQDVDTNMFWCKSKNNLPVRAEWPKKFTHSDKIAKKTKKSGFLPDFPMQSHQSDSLVAVMTALQLSY